MTIFWYNSLIYKLILFILHCIGMFWDTLIFNHWSINLHSLIVLALSYYSFIFFSIVLYLLSTTSKTRIEQQMTLLDTLPKCCRNNFSVLWTILVEFCCKEFKCLTETITVATYKTTLKQIPPPAFKNQPCWVKSYCHIVTKQSIEST